METLLDKRSHTGGGRRKAALRGAQPGLSVSDVFSKLLWRHPLHGSPCVEYPRPVTSMILGILPHPYQAVGGIARKAHVVEFARPRVRPILRELPWRIRKDRDQHTCRAKTGVDQVAQIVRECSMLVPVHQEALPNLVQVRRVNYPFAKLAASVESREPRSEVDQVAQQDNPKMPAPHRQTRLLAYNPKQEKYPAYPGDQKQRMRRQTQQQEQPYGDSSAHEEASTHSAKQTADRDAPLLQRETQQPGAQRNTQQGRTPSNDPAPKKDSIKEQLHVSPAMNATGGSPGQQSCS